MTSPGQRWRALGHRGAPTALVLVAFAACYSAFLGKAFHVDDPLFVWAARQISEHPLDFYGFEVNWRGAALPMSEVMKNPPGASYYLAIAGKLLGWSEPALHLAMLLPALGALLGVLRLARELGARARESMLALAVSPVFFVSSTTLMCDVLMLCLWVWAVVAWHVGLARRGRRWLAVGALLIVAAALTKYLAIGLVPLLFAYAFARERHVGAWAAWLAGALVVLAAYDVATGAMYGQGLLRSAAGFAEGAPEKHAWRALPEMGTGLAFAGGCCLPAALSAPRLWPRRGLLAGVGVAGATAALVLLAGRIGTHAVHGPEGIRWAIVLQFAALVAAGVGLVALAAAELREGRDAGSLLLFLWIIGTLGFAAVVNWVVSARALLPLAPPVALLVTRRAARREGGGVGPTWGRVLPLVAAGAASFAIARADARLADASREAPRLLAPELRQERVVWFLGHWGFQYYAELAGWRPHDLRRDVVLPGDVVVKPGTNSYQVTIPGTIPVKVLRLPVMGWLTTMNAANGAGFYADIWGPLPFALGDVHDEVFEVSVATATVTP